MLAYIFIEALNKRFFFLPNGHETGLNRKRPAQQVARGRSSRLDADARTKKDHPTDDPFSFERETGLEMPVLIS